MKNSAKKNWEKPVIKSNLSISKTLGTTNPGAADNNPGGNKPRS